jgi:DNA-binding response OmpR family regulator
MLKMPNPRVLVIDDDPTFRSLLVAALRRDYMVSVASDGEEGFEKAVEWNPDVVVLDHQMEGWDGIRTLPSFRQHFMLKKVPVIMCTADASRATVMTALNEGAADYMVKTSYVADLLRSKVVRAMTLHPIQA